MEKPLPAIPAKRYFTIGEVSDLCGVKPYVLRYWEQEFTQLKPMKRRGNRRYYQHHEVLLIRRIRELLYDQGFTISGARNRLADAGLGGRGAVGAKPGEAPLLEPPMPVAGSGLADAAGDDGVGPTPAMQREAPGGAADALPRPAAGVPGAPGRALPAAADSEAEALAVAARVIATAGTVRQREAGQADPVPGGAAAGQPTPSANRTPAAAAVALSRDALRAELLSIRELLSA